MNNVTRWRPEAFAERVVVKKSVQSAGKNDLK